MCCRFSALSLYAPPVAGRGPSDDREPMTDHTAVDVTVPSEIPRDCADAMRPRRGRGGRELLVFPGLVPGGAGRGR